MKTLSILISLALMPVFSKPKQTTANWVFCTTTGNAAYASSLVTYKVDDWKELLQAWKLRVRQEVGTSYNEHNFTFRIIDRECSTGNVAYDSKYAASQGRDCYMQNFRNKGVDVKILALDY